MQSIGRPDRRRHIRPAAGGLATELGVVIDLSAGGMRMMSIDAPDGPQSITLLSADGEITVRGRVIWSRRIGFRRWESGLAFVDLDDATRARIESIAAAHRAALAG